MKQDTLIYDIDKIAEFVFDNPNGRTNDVEILETYIYDNEQDKMVLDSKQVKEVKVNDYTTHNTLRYDMIKMFIETLDSIEDPKIMSLGENITFNTMQAYGLIKDIKNNDNE